MLRAWRALVVVCALGLIAGCASGASSASADVRVVAAVSARLDQVASARMTSTVTARRDGRTIVMLALSGAIRFSDHAIRLAGTGSAADHSVLPKVEMIVRDQVLYLQGVSVPPLGTAAPPRWFAAYDPTGALGAFNGQLGCQPAAVIADLARSGGKVTVVGRSKVRGVPATQFQVTFRPGDRLNVWVDAKGLLRRYQLSIDIGNVEQVGTDDFYDFGVPVTVSAPPASQVQFIPDADPNKKVAVYVAATDIPAGSPGDSLIAASDFQQSTVPVRSYPRDALTNLGEIRGKVTTIPITKGQVIIATQFDAPSHTPTTTTQTAPPTGNGC